MLETIIQSIDAMQAKRRILKHENGLDEDGIKIKTLLGTKIIDKNSLSYLWMAIESDMNILILGDGLSGKKPFLYSLFPLIPSYDKTLAFDCHSKSSRYYENIISYVSSKPAEIRSALRSVNAFQANRIVVAALEKFHKETFSCANKGIPSISTMDGEGPAAIDLLKKNRVPANMLSMLDIVVSIGRAEDSIWKVEGINEYLWFSRSEYFMEEATATKNFELKMNSVLREGKFNTRDIGLSKMVRAYSNLNVVSKKEAIDEFRQRSEFLERSTESNLPSREYVDSYFEIK
jgi:hypothetical protein